jgi:hypothetical protein
MINLKRIGILLLVLGVTTAFIQAAEKEAKAEAKPDAILRLSNKSIAAGVGFSWGSGTLTYKGKDYPVKVSGLSVGKVGITGTSATGQVYNLKSLRDFDGHYTAGGVGGTLGGGRNKVALKNQNDVQVLLASTARGVDITVGGGGVEMKIKK